jgi:diguanylate cyclase (GGDEF)-like protein
VTLLGLGRSSPDTVLRLNHGASVVLMAGVFVQARRIEAPGGHRTGRRVALTSLCAIIADLGVLGVLEWLDPRVLGPLQALRPYHALLDLLLFTGLGFGQVLLVMETVSADLARSNRELTAARDRLEEKATVDPLTSALNRHAFHSLVSERAPDAAKRSGCVVLIDIDNLKALNDTRGHAAGDQAIRAAAASIRHMIRADDLLFRWGGDEFLAVLFGLSKEGADARLRALSELHARDARAPRLSWGVSSFEELSRLGDAIEAADRAMYAGRARRRANA